MQQLVFYTTAGCHLCEQAEIMLVYLESRDDVSIARVDIADSEKLVAQYGKRIPVLRQSRGGKELSWPFEFGEILALLD